MKSILFHFSAVVTLLLIHSQALADNSAGQAFSVWPDTGQATCYTETGATLSSCPSFGQPNYGQDAQYAGPHHSYTKLDITGKELPVSASAWVMVRDNVTGLIWELKTAKDGSPLYSNNHDADNTYTWCNTDTNTNGGGSGTCGGNNIMTFLAALNTGSGFAGHADWRIPTIAELSTLTDLGRYNPAIDTTYFSGTQSLPYWSATTWASLSNYAWFVTFDSGTVWINNNTKDNSYYVRAVRGGKVPPVSRFVDNQNGTVIDTWTCLQWQQATADTNGNGSTDTADTVLWADALAYAENLTLGGHTDWRLPSLNELRSLVDFSRSSPSIDTTAFPDTPPSQYWSSTSGAFGPINAWALHFNSGYENASDKDGVASHRYVRTVRGRQCSTFPWPMYLPAISGSGN